MTDFVGIWHICEMDGWDAGYFNMEVQAYIEIEPNGLGTFQFGLVSGQLDGKVVPYGRSKRFEFTWDGSDEMDAANGSGWVQLKDADELEGEFRFHLGDDSGFCARKAN